MLESGFQDKVKMIQKMTENTRFICKFTINHQRQNAQNCNFSGFIFCYPARVVKAALTTFLPNGDQFVQFERIWWIFLFHG